MKVRFAVCLIYAGILGVILILFVCSYTEIDSHHIATFFKLGPVRLKLLSARWEDVRHAEYSVSRSRSSSMAELRLFTNDGTTITFNASPFSPCDEHFESIAKHFPKKSPETAPERTASGS